MIRLLIVAAVAMSFALVSEADAGLFGRRKCKKAQVVCCEPVVTTCAPVCEPVCEPACPSPCGDACGGDILHMDAVPAEPTPAEPKK